MQPDENRRQAEQQRPQEQHWHLTKHSTQFFYGYYVQKPFFLAKKKSKSNLGSQKNVAPNYKTKWNKKATLCKEEQEEAFAIVRS